MSDPWIAAIYVTAFVVIGVIIAVVVLARARTAQALADADNAERYRSLAEQSATSQQQAAAELARLSERVAAVEKLLREVG